MIKSKQLRLERQAYSTRRRQLELLAQQKLVQERTMLKHEILSVQQEVEKELVV